MRCESFRDGPKFVVRISGERKRDAGYKVVGMVALTALADFALQDLWERVGATILGGLYTTYTVCEVQFGSSEMQVGVDAVTFVTKGPGWKRPITYPRADVEKLGFLLSADEVPTALGMMVRTVMMPIRFGIGISREEANALLAELRRSDCWIAARTLRADAPLF